MTVVPRKRSQSADPASSPKTAKYQKVQKRSIQQQAFDELLVLKNANGGKLKYGDYIAIEHQFHRRKFYDVTVDNLRYRMKCFKKSGQLKLVTETNKPASHVMLKGPNTTVSPLTDPGNDVANVADANNANTLVGTTSTSTTQSATTDSTPTTIQVSPTNTTINSNSNDEMDNGKGKKLTKKEKEEADAEHLRRVLLARTKISIEYSKLQRTSSKIANGTLEKLIKTVTKEYNLQPSDVPRDTIKSRLRRKNLGGVAPQKLSPLHDLEPLLVEWSLKMAKIGQALSRTNVLELASELIEGTEFEEKVKTFKAKRNIKMGIMKVK
jgi:hypothetical protein